MRRSGLSAATFFALLACTQAPAAQNPNEQNSSAADAAPATSSDYRPQTGLRTVPLTIHSKNGVHRFNVQIAATPDQQEKGLMFVTSLADDAGMIFPYDPPQEVAFWMKNTLIPLDIIYVGAGGKIVRITQAKALDETPLPSGAPVIGVLEIRGGRAPELGIKEGDTVSWTN